MPLYPAAINGKSIQPRPSADAAAVQRGLGAPEVECQHIGDLPGYPASAGCIRLPSNVAPIMFELTKSGTTVKVVDSWQPTSTMVASR